MFTIDPDSKFQREALFHSLVAEFLHRQNGLHFFDTGHLARFAQGWRGQPDFIVCKEGKFIALELKAGKAKLSQGQVHQKKWVEEKGDGKYALCYTLRDVGNAVGIEWEDIAGN